MPTTVLPAPPPEFQTLRRACIIFMKYVLIYFEVSVLTLFSIPFKKLLWIERKIGVTSIQNARIQGRKLMISRTF